MEEETGDDFSSNFLPPPAIRSSTSLIEQCWIMYYNSEVSWLRSSPLRSVIWNLGFCCFNTLLHRNPMIFCIFFSMQNIRAFPHIFPGWSRHMQIVFVQSLNIPNRKCHQCLHIQLHHNSPCLSSLFRLNLIILFMHRNRSKKLLQFSMDGFWILGDYI